jgi:hypothetical protein
MLVCLAMESPRKPMRIRAMFVPPLLLATESVVECVVTCQDVAAGSDLRSTQRTLQELVRLSA